MRKLSIQETKSTSGAMVSFVPNDKGATIKVGAYDYFSYIDGDLKIDFTCSGGFYYEDRFVHAPVIMDGFEIAHAFEISNGRPYGVFTLIYR